MGNDIKIEYDKNNGETIAKINGKKSPIITMANVLTGKKQKKKKETNNKKIDRWDVFD